MRVAVAMAIALPALASCHHRHVETIEIPRFPGHITVDGQFDELAWRQIAFVSPALEDSRGGSAPFSNVRLLGDAEKLYVAVYVSDDDLRSDDGVELRIGDVDVTLTPRGARSKTPGVESAMDLDGTVDDGRDLDEEWLSEVSIPWSGLGGNSARDEGVDVRVTRTDARAHGREHALAWPRFGTVRIRLAPKPHWRDANL